jgi:hypothetical protein
MVAVLACLSISNIPRLKLRDLLFSRPDEIVDTGAPVKSVAPFQFVKITISNNQ